MNKKGVIESLQALIIPLIGIGIVLTIGFLIMAEAGDQAKDSAGASSFAQCNSSACNGTRDTMNAIADIPGWLPIIVITVIGALLLGLVSVFRGRR